MLITSFQLNKGNQERGWRGGIAGVDRTFSVMRKLIIYYKISWIALKSQYKVKDTPPPLPSCTHGKTVYDHDSTEFSTQKKKNVT